MKVNTENNLNRDAATALPAAQWRYVELRPVD